METIETNLTQDDRDFIEKKLPEVTGWLFASAAYFTCYLMNAQSGRGIRGPALEFGVYHGKYLCTLLNCALKQDEWVGGFDTFELCHPETAWTHAEQFFGSRERMALWKGSTHDYSAEQVAAMIGAPPRIVSVDGDHTAEGALHDLRLASKVVVNKGVISLDDVFNSFAVGVAEGSFRFLLAKDCDFVPFAHIGNKTFLCRKAHYAEYFRLALQFVEDCPDLEVVATFKANREKGESWVIQRLMGVDVVLLN